MSDDDDVESIMKDLVNVILSDATTDKLEERSFSTHRYSRSCAICLKKSPRQRSFFSGCGHIICRACAVQLAMQAAPTWRQPSCPLCRQKSKPISLIEEAQYDYDAFVLGIRSDRAKALNDSAQRLPTNNGERWWKLRELLVLKALGRQISMLHYFDLYDTHLRREASIRVYVSFEDVLEEEGRRLDTMLPHAAGRRHLADYAIQAVWRREQLQLIEHLRAEDQTSNSENRQYCRACIVCDFKQPRNRSAFTYCGHSLCRDCAEKSDTCPKCRQDSDNIELFEDLIEAAEDEQTI